VVRQVSGTGEEPYLVAPADALAALLLDLLLPAQVAAEQVLLQGPGGTLLGQQPLDLRAVLLQLQEPPTFENPQLLRQMFLGRWSQGRSDLAIRSSGTKTSFLQMRQTLLSRRHQSGIPSFLLY